MIKFTPDVLQQKMPKNVDFGVNICPYMPMRYPYRTMAYGLKKNNLKVTVPYIS